MIRRTRRFDLPRPREGQLWASCDPRFPGRVVEVVGIADYDGVRLCECLVVRNYEGFRRSTVGRHTWIRVDRMRPTRNGYQFMGWAERPREGAVPIN